MVGMAVATLVMGACGGDKEPLGPTATVPQATTTTNPYAIPPVIDEAYVNRVLAGLDHAVGDVVRLVVSSKTIPPEAIERLKAIYVDDEQFQFELQLFQADLRGGFKAVKPSPGNRATTVLEIMSTRPDCIFARVDMDTSAVTLAPNPAFRTRWIAIVPRLAGISAPGNETGWGVVYEGFPPDQSTPSNPCAER
ncbi:MAG: hypothetical protein QOI99_338 [Actinomycetota bacterium]|nr:hypothetical protein [Actinomycetota bacterium]